MKRTGAWIDVWDIAQAKVHDVFELKLTQTGERFQCGEDLEKLTEENWAPKAKAGWTSSWVPFVQSVSYTRGQFSNGVVEIKLGTMAYKEIEAINHAIEEGLDWAPAQGFNPCLSVGFPVVTDDKKVVFQRRPADVHCPNVLIHEPCGYMTSLAFSSRTECGNPEFEQDSRLFDLRAQLDFRKKAIAETFGLDEPRVRGKVFARDEHRVGGWLESHTRPVLEERVPDCCLDDLGLVAAGDLDLPDHEAREGLVRGCLRAAADDDCRRDDGRNQNNETLEHGIPFWSP